MIVAGIGCRSDATVASILEAVTSALQRYDLVRAELNAIATDASKYDEHGISTAARYFGIPLVFVTLDEMQRVQNGALTISPRVVALKGVPSVAETAALAAAGRSARLLGPRLTTETVTCAIAVGEGP